MSHITLSRNSARPDRTPDPSSVVEVATGARRTVRALKAAALGLLFAAASFAQSTAGSIVGEVTDPSGAVIRDASITATNAGTGLERTAKTGTDGFYRLPNMEPGTYTVTSAATGFGPVERKGIELQAREEVRLDLKHALGAAQTSIEVTAATPVITEQLTISDSKSGDVINSLPLNFRATANPSPLQVAPLAAGVNSDSGGNFTFSGQLPNATSFSLDGISTQLPRVGGPTKDLFPSVESISEFRINTAANSAEFAQPTDLTVITKSGVNSFHGGAFWYLQRKDFNSADKISGAIPTGDADTFGTSLSGPIRKNKAFFFFDYEGVRLDQNTVIQMNTAPSAWRTGDFSATGVTVLNPLTGQPFAGGKIAPSLISPVATKALGYFFPAQTTGGGALTGNPNFVQQYPGQYKADGFDGRLDYNFSEKHTIWGRVTQKQPGNTGTDSATGDTVYNPTLGVYNTSIDATNIAGAWNWIVKVNLINEFRAGYSKANFGFSYPQAAQGDAIIKDLGIGGLPGSPKNGLGGVPVFYIGSLLGGATNPTVGHPRVQNNDTLQFADTVSWIKGSHTLKFGGEWRKLRYQDNITFLSGDEYGDYFFTGDFTSGLGAVPKNGDVHGFADFLLGFVADAYQAQNVPDGKPYGYHYGMFANDEWRLRPNLKVTLGLRYELNTPFNDQTNQLGNFDRNTPGGRLVVQGTAGLALVNPLWKAAVGNTPFVTNDQAGLPNTLRYMDKSNIQPRFGISWSPGNDNKTVVRGAIGVYSVPVLGAVLYSLLGVDTSYFAEYPSSATNIRTFNNVFSGSSAGVSYPSYRRANQYDLKDPKVVQWNFSFDHELPWNILARASYTGSHTWNLIYSPDLNQVQPNTVGYAALTATAALRAKNLKFPNFSEVLTRDNGPSSDYHALTFEANKRFSNSLSFQNNYTLAFNMTNALGTAPNSAVPVGGQVDNGGNVQNAFDISADRGNAYYTPRHRFVSTFVYNLPIGRGQKYFGNVSRAANLLVGGWGVTGVTIAQTGNFLTPYYASSLYDSSGTNPSQRSVKQQRPDCVAGKSGYLNNPTNAAWFDISAFTIPGSVNGKVPSAPIGRYGNCSTGILQGPGTVTYSMSVGKTFQLTERIGFRYEAQFANLFNILNRANPSMDIGSSSFGTITSSQLTQQAGPRSVQMMLRLQF